MRSFLDLTENFPVAIDLPRLRKELTSLERANWVPHYDRTQPDEWTTIPLRSINGSMRGPDSIRHGPYEDYQNTPILDHLPYFAEIISAFKCPIARIRISKMAPRSAINPHRDVLQEVASVAFGQVRLHIPILTSDKVVFHVGDDRLHLAAGRLYYVDFAKNHWVVNDGDEPRVHLFLECQMNDWMKNLFPPFTAADHLDMSAQRIFLPLFWKARRMWLFNENIRSLRNTYEQSIVQDVVHWARGRSR